MYGFSVQLILVYSICNNGTSKMAAAAAVARTQGEDQGNASFFFFCVCKQLHDAFVFVDFN